MSRPTLLPITLLLLASLACNAPFMQSTTPVPAPTQAGSASLPTSASRPQIVIEAPASGSQAVVKQVLTVRVHATDSVGITRVEMHESGRIVVSQPSPDPDPDFTALLNYRPSNTGPVTLELVAYSQNAASEPVSLTIDVVASEADLKNPGSFNPTMGVAAGAICTARSNISGLSLRAGPGTNYRVLALLKVGEALSVIGRNPAATWYQVKRSGNTTTGWVSAAYTSADGDCSKAPITTPTP